VAGFLAAAALALVDDRVPTGVIIKTITLDISVSLKPNQHHVENIPLRCH